MSFLNAGLLGLGALFAVPLIIHLINRRRFVRRKWAAMEFLLRAYQQNRRRLRLESLILLLLRCAIPILLAIAVARPKLSSSLGIDPLDRRGPHHVFVLDRSYSMGYSEDGITPFDRMKRAVSTLLEQIGARGNEKVSMVYADPEVGTPVRGDLDVGKAVRALSRLEKPSDGRSNLGAALTEAKRLATEEPEQPRIYVFSDFQKQALIAQPLAAADPAAEAERGADVTQPGRAAPTGQTTTTTGQGDAGNLRALRDLVQDLRDGGAEVVFFPLAPKSAVANAQILTIQIEPENAVAKVAATVRASLIQRGGSARDVLARLKVDGANEQTRRVRLEVGEVSDVQFSVRFLEEGIHSLELRIDEDALPVDDVRRHIVKVRDRIKVLLVEGRESANEDEVLQQSFLYRYILDPMQGEGGDVLTTFSTQVIDEDSVQGDASYVRDQDVIALLDVTAPRPKLAKRLRDFVLAGGGLLLAPGQNAIPDLYNLHLFGIDGEAGPLPLRLLEMGGGALPSRDDPAPSRHGTPRIAAEKHATLVDFKVAALKNAFELTPLYRWWSTARNDVPEASKILVEIRGDGEPQALLATRRFGQGECMLLTSNLTRRPDRWNRLDDLDAIRFPLLHSIAHWLAREPKDQLNRLVGESINTWLPHKPKSLYVIRPEQQGRSPLPLPKASTQGDRKRAPGWTLEPYHDTKHSGIYRIAVEYEDQTLSASELAFAINPDPEEGVLDYMNGDELASQFAADVRESLELDSGEVTESNTSEIGRLMLLLALLAAVAESILAGRLGGRRT